jgi:hypothetical protein
VRNDPYREGQHVRDRLTHEAFVIDTIYADGWLLVHTAAGDERHVEPQDVEPDPYYEGR